MAGSLNSLSGSIIISISLEIFSPWDFFLFPSFERDSSGLFVCLTFYICLYELGKMAASFSLGKWPRIEAASA